MPKVGSTWLSGSCTAVSGLFREWVPDQARGQGGGHGGESRLTSPQAGASVGESPSLYKTEQSPFTPSPRYLFPLHEKARVCGAVKDRYRKDYKERE